MGDDVKEYVKIPSFNGEEDEWNAWSDVFISVMEQKGYEVLVDCLDDENVEIPMDGKKCKEDSIEEILKKQNRKASTYLLTAMNRKVDKGKEAFDIVQLYKDKTIGYKSGNFKLAWKALEDLYNSDDPTSKTDLKKMYDGMELKYGSEERPAKFISELRGLKKKLAKVGRIISEEDFMTDILSKLPPPSKPGEDAPYATIQQLIEKDLEERPDKMTVTKIQKLLTARHKALFQIGKDEEEIELSANQVKVKCFKCGDWGHKSYDCPDKKSPNDNKSGSYQGRFGRKDMKCLFCGKPNHSAQNCWDLKKKKEEETKKDEEQGAVSYEVILTGIEIPAEEEEYWSVDDNDLEMSFEDEEELVGDAAAVATDEEEDEEDPIDKSGRESVVENNIVSVGTVDCRDPNAEMVTETVADSEVG